MVERGTFPISCCRRCLIVLCCFRSAVLGLVGKCEMNGFLAPEGVLKGVSLENPHLLSSSLLSLLRVVPTASLTSLTSNQPE